MMAVNFEGVWRGCQEFGRRLIEQGIPAGLYNTGSENSFFVAVGHSAAYVASKHAVLGLTDCLREEMPEYISVGMIAPGFVGSELIPEPMRPLGMPVDDFAEILEVYSDEPEDQDGVGDGSTTGDIALTDATHFAIRAERQGAGNGRVYGVRFRLWDSEGNETEDFVTVSVPHDRSGRAAIDDGPDAGYVVQP